MSEKEIAYDVRLEEELEKVKNRIWLQVELQVQPKQFHGLIIHNFEIKG